MAAHPSSLGGGGKPSFVEILSAKLSMGFESKSFASLMAIDTVERVQAVASPHCGEPAVCFSMDDIEKVAAPFQFSLVGKFSRGRLYMEDLRKFFCTLDLKGEVSLGLLDRRHVLIRLEHEADYYRVWARNRSTLCVVKPNFCTTLG